MNTYIQKKSKYNAIQFTGDNREKIIDALQTKKEFVQMWRNEDTKACYLTIHDPNFDLGQVQEKQWILVTIGKSAYIIMDDKDFQENYQEIKE